MTGFFESVNILLFRLFNADSVAPIVIFAYSPSSFGVPSDSQRLALNTDKIGGLYANGEMLTVQDAVRPRESVTVKIISCEPAFSNSDDVASLVLYVCPFIWIL